MIQNNNYLSIALEKPGAETASNNFCSHSRCESELGLEACRRCKHSGQIVYCCRLIKNQGVETALKINLPSKLGLERCKEESAWLET